MLLSRVYPFFTKNQRAVMNKIGFLHFKFYSFLMNSVYSTTVKISDTNINNIPSVPATKTEYLQKLLLQVPQSPANSKLLKVAVVGCPNSGKSTLVNLLTKWNVCAVAGKAHTTRSKQMAALVQDDTQIVFVDLPGLVNKNKLSKFNLEKTFIRDPHSAIFDADLILIVVDVGHKYSRLQLDYEVMKLLHFFEDKPSVLVLNKIDKLGKKRVRLLDITRNLTGGVVGGVQSSFDKYSARFERRAKMSPRAHQLIPPSEIIFAHLPPVCHEVVNKFLNHLVNLQRQLASKQFDLLSTPSVDKIEHCNQTIQTLDVTASESKSELVVHTTGAIMNYDDSFLKDREISLSERVDIDTYFTKYSPRSPDRQLVENESNRQLSVRTSSEDVQIEQGLKDLAQSQNELQLLTEASVDSMLEELKNQLVLKTATLEQVAERRKRWLEVSRRVKGMTQWKKFNEVFMISSFDLVGINRLRDYLVSRALPNKSWIMPLSMVTDQEPSELVRMCVWAQCLQSLRMEIPYRLKIIVDDCDKIKEADGDDRIYVHARLQCESERHLKMVLGPAGQTIKEIAAATKLELMTMFRNDTVVKLSAELMKIPKKVRRKLKTAKDFSDVFPHFSEDKE